MNGRSYYFLIAGDVLTLLLVTVFGFATHGELSTAGFRMLTTLFPLLAGWAAAAPWLGVYDIHIAGDMRQIWRPLWAMMLAAPLAALLRAIWLGSVVIPTFALVLGGVSAACIVIWRSLYALLLHQAVLKPKI